MILVEAEQVMVGFSTAVIDVPSRRSVAKRQFFAILALALVVGRPAPTPAADIGYVPLFDGERSDGRNLWDGVFSSGNTLGLSRQTSLKRSGNFGYLVNLGPMPAGSTKFFQTFSSSLTGSQAHRQDRDLTQYQALSGYVWNDSPNALTFSLEIKDYRDSTAQRAVRSYTVPGGGGWTKIEAPLDLGSGWTVTGAPDLKRTYAVSFLVDAEFGELQSGLVLDDFGLTENGPSVDAATAPIRDVVERLAYRQFNGLWAARNKTSGLIPNSAGNVSIGALNTTTGVVWNLPAAIRRGWVAQADADAYMATLVNSLNANRNQTTYLPTRFLDLATAAPVTDREESTIDAAFIALALHNYKSQAATPTTLAAAIDTLESRFDFSAFTTSGAFRQAYFPSSGYGCCTYSGYTNEHKVIAVAAQLADDVPLAGQWNKDTGRTLASLVNSDNRYLVYSFGTEYRAPFVQALLNLFVDTSDRGVDSYPTRSLARNPWINYQLYEADVAAKLDQLGREYFFQPDAGAAAGTYQPWNLFNNFGQPNVFQPWSVALAMLAGAPGSEESLRFLLDNGLGTGLDGPLGLADSAVWATGAANPTSVPSFVDNWNTALSTMAFMELLDKLDGQTSSSRFFADLAELDAALDAIFVDGDVTGNGQTNQLDRNVIVQGYGALAGASPQTGDADGDGDVDGADLMRWQRGLNVPPAAARVPEPQVLSLLSWPWLYSGTRRLRVRETT